ncbi:hypothetical protein DM860_005572 [Cuscuta australis]|uniref:PHD-type domain-containing protein n=1 Tax=Cuscuta australis TaxID=267555 RepID=A0A328DUD7_9ASTE|nr:hypothetical protein DM860_005572 [Cuscuta australis]
MACEEKQSNGCGGSSSSCLRLAAENGQAINNSTAFGVEIANGSGRSADTSGNCLRTYKRRKIFKAKGVHPDDSPGQSSHKPVDSNLLSNSYSQTSVAQVQSNGLLNDPINLSKNKWRNVALEQIYQSLESDGGLKKCLSEALAPHPDTQCDTSVKGNGNCFNDDTNCTIPSNSTTSDGPAKGNMDMSSTRLVNGPINCTTTQICQRLFLDIILSDDFSQLCRTIFENFEGTRADKFLNIGTMHSKMKAGLYEDIPMSFHSDIQEVWSKLQKVGSEILAISKCLSNKSTSYFQSQFVTQEPDTYCRADCPKTCTCKHCGKKADGNDSLVCDSCEEMYHVSCIQPPVKEIPPKSWYCAKCTENGIESPHDNCVVCERLNAPKEKLHQDDLMTLEKLTEMDEGSNRFSDDDEVHVQAFNEEHICNVCRTEAKRGENLLMCSHKFCPHKFYHQRCLNKQELRSYGPLWYCPSCLCRACLKNRDDDEIVLCDGCDYAYHIYCLQPPMSSIPTGEWFCKGCEASKELIAKVKRSYELINKRSKERPQVCGGLHEKKGRDEAVLDKSGGGGGVDMLLNAAKTLNYEEDLAGKEGEG